jgi:cytochrome c oxidase subunit I+III
MVYMTGVLNSQLALAVAVMGVFVLARLLVGRQDASRRVSFDNTALLAYYTVGQSLVGLLLIHGFPRVVD